MDLREVSNVCSDTILWTFAKHSTNGSNYGVGPVITDLKLSYCHYLRRAE